MREVKIKKYIKKFSYSYALGYLATMELLKTKPEKVIKVIVKNLPDKTNELKNITELCQKNNIRAEIDSHLIDKIATRENTYVMAVFEKYTDELEKNQNHIILVNPSDAGNVGTIIRSMFAFDFVNLALIKPAVDVFDPKVISTTTGTIFNVRIKYFDSFEDYQQNFPLFKFYPFMLNGKKTLEEVNFIQPFGLIFGNETRGLDEKFLTFENSVLISHSKRVDSLNLAISAGIGLYKSYLQIK